MMRKWVIFISFLFLGIGSCSVPDEVIQLQTPTIPTIISTEPVATKTLTETSFPQDKRKTAEAKAANLTEEAAIVLSKTLLPTITRRPTITSLPTQTALSIWDEDWHGREIRSLCLSIQQEYPQFESKQGEPMDAALISYLQEMGITVINDPQICDASLEILLSGEAITGKYYVSGGSKECYSGSFFEGEFQLSGAGQENPVLADIHRSFIPDVISKCYEEPNQDIRWSEGWKYALLDGIGQIWGKDALLILTSVETLGVPCQAVGVISRWKNLRDDLDPEDIPILLTRLERCSEEVSHVFQILGVEAWGAIPAILDSWGNLSESDYRSMFYNDSLRKITETYRPRPTCNMLSCWRTWWGSGKMAP